MLQGRISNRVMEARDHFKNGASSKSQTSRWIFFKTWTKPVVLVFVISIFALTGCDKNAASHNADEFWLKMGDNSIVSTSDIDFYNVSLHTIYLKNEVPYLRNVHGAVSVYVGNKEIYKCSIHSAICSHIPMGEPYIWGLILNEEKICILFNPINEKQKDPRNDKRIIAALKKNNLYRK